jgi:hypothetical protein
MDASIEFSKLLKPLNLPTNERNYANAIMATHLYDGYLVTNDNVISPLETTFELSNTIASPVIIEELQAYKNQAFALSDNDSENLFMGKSVSIDIINFLNSIAKNEIETFNIFENIENNFKSRNGLK